MTEPVGWLTVRRGGSPLLVSLPHTGTRISPELEARFVSPWLARKDTDWWIDRLYGFAADLDATLVHTAISRSVIDVNRDPSGASLYPGQATTELCPATSFDGEPLYRPGDAPTDADIEARRSWFDPYHAALAQEIARLRRLHRQVVLYDCHSIRSAIPRLFEGVLPVFNIGTNVGAACAPELVQTISSLCDASGESWVVDGRFKGGFITRRYGDPAAGVHAIQMELACRAYMREEPGPVTQESWPTPFEPSMAASAIRVLRPVLAALDRFARA